MVSLHFFNYYLSRIDLTKNHNFKKVVRGIKKKIHYLVTYVACKKGGSRNRNKKKKHLKKELSSFFLKP